MLLLSFLAIIVIWLACGLLGYVIARAAYRNGSKPWRESERAFFLTASLFFGPFAILSSLLLWLTTPRSEDKVVKW